MNLQKKIICFSLKTDDFDRNFSLKTDDFDRN